MAKKEINSSIIENAFEDVIKSSDVVMKVEKLDREFIKPPVSIDEYLEERKDQRKKILNVSIGIATYSSIGTAILIMLQVIVKVCCNKELLNGWELEIISTGIFLQTFGIIRTVSGKLWDSKTEENLFNSSKK